MKTNKNNSADFANEQFAIVKINPHMAKMYLRNVSPEARKQYPKIVSKYAADMRNNCWKTNYDPIVFDEEGKLYRGVQRLAALAESGHTHKFLVIRNCQKGLAHYDMGRYCSSAVNISHAYYEQLAWVNSMTTAMLNFVHGVFPDAVYKDNDRYASYITKYEEHIRHIETMLIGSECGLNRAFIRAAITLALISGADETLVDEMCRVLKDADYKAEKRVADKNFHELRNYILAREGSLVNTPAVLKGLFMTIANVLKATEENKSVGMLNDKWENKEFPYNVYAVKEDGATRCVYKPLDATKKTTTKKETKKTNKKA